MLKLMFVKAVDIKRNDILITGDINYNPHIKGIVMNSDKNHSTVSTSTANIDGKLLLHTFHEKAHVPILRPMFVLPVVEWIPTLVMEGDYKTNDVLITPHMDSSAYVGMVIDPNVYDEHEGNAVSQWVYVHTATRQKHRIDIAKHYSLEVILRPSFAGELPLQRAEDIDIEAEYDLLTQEQLQEIEEAKAGIAERMNRAKYSSASGQHN